MQNSKPVPAEVARILIVDRDRSAAYLLGSELGAILPSRPEVIDVPNGRMAVDLLRAGTVDVLLVDLQSLSDLCPTAEDGIAKLVKLASGALTVALSDGGSVSAALAAMRAGAHDVMPRPAGGAAIAARIGALAQRHGRAWSLPGSTSGEMAAMLNSAGAALRSAGEPPKRAEVLPMWQQEQRIIEDAIASFAGNITLAAQALELNPSTIYRKRQAWAEMETATKGAA